jgi:hypothetical protein
MLLCTLRSGQTIGGSVDLHLCCFNLQQHATAAAAAAVCPPQDYMFVYTLDGLGLNSLSQRLCNLLCRMVHIHNDDVELSETLGMGIEQVTPSLLQVAEAHTCIALMPCIRCS